MTRRRGAGRAGRLAAAAVGDGTPAAGNKPAPVGWSDLSADEQAALKRLNRGPCPGIDPALAATLLGKGLAVPHPDGIRIGRAGREMVIEALLRAGREA